MRVTQAVEEGKPEEALTLLENLRETESTHPSFHLQLGHAYRRLARCTEAEASYERVLELDPQNVPAFVGLAMVHLDSGRADLAVNAALSATELRFHLPRAHYLLGCSLAELGEAEHAARAFRVAIGQAGGFAEAHRALADLLEVSSDAGERAKAEEHRRLAGDVCRERVWHQSLQRDQGRRHATRDVRTKAADGDAWFAPTRGDRAGWVDRDPAGVITVVSGLPRTGTSMMMQLLVAGGLEPVTDDHRRADDSNPCGYFEDDRVGRLAKDASWMAEARGRVVKVVAPLLRFLPATEYYQVVFLERDVEEVLASQRVMLERLGRAGSGLSASGLRRAFTRQLEAAREFMDRSDRIRVRFFRYGDVVADPSSAVDELADFLGSRGWLPSGVRVDAAAVVDARLHRQRRTGRSSHGRE
ncbi:MAG: tetratricopeptide repeat protein [Pseudomonadota bacterium]